ncbi:hypothetical protein BGZ94_004947, partial [Podila epigama]
MSSIPTSKPLVIISGGGLAGLTLAILLHRANVPFVVLERAREIKPLGSFVALGVLTGPLFKQLGLWGEFVALARPIINTQFYTEDVKPSFSLGFEWAEAMTGYHQHVISRPDLYNLLLSQIPPENILLGKRILTYEETDDAVQQLKEANKLPVCDDVALPYSCACLVGQTEVLDPEEFSVLKEDVFGSTTVLGRDNQCSWITMATKQNTVCWMVIQFLNKETYKNNDTFRTSEWGPEAAEAFANEVKSFKLPGLRNGQPLTLGDYVEKTPSKNISKIMLEEIVFKTWHSGRAVLIGDVGAAHAMLDAATLANWISTLYNPSVKDLETIFTEYRNERYPVAKEAFASSQMFRLVLGK